ELLRMPPVVASTVALAMAIGFNYYFQRRITFRSNAKHYVAAPRFVGITLCTLGANAVIFGALVSYIPYLPAQVITLGIIFPINYYLNKRITFRS
ncbi:MAG TPA: GtrA family protein, partial [Methylomirabilota bacterium]|nr:GtrA family protein [Methylomirabilota bacterium]